MAGLHLPIIRKSDFSLQVSATTNNVSDAILEPLVDTLSWVSGVGIVRVYSSTAAYPASATLRVLVVNAMNGPDDPNTVLVPSSGSMCDIVIPQNTTNALLVSSFTLPIGRYGRVLLRATSGGTAGTILCTCAVDLVGRDA